MPAGQQGVTQSHGKEPRPPLTWQNGKTLNQPATTSCKPGLINILRKYGIARRGTARHGGG